MKDTEDRISPQLAAAMDRVARTDRRTSVEIDVERYQAFLDDPALTADQKSEIVKALWTIISAFVELGFGVHPAQQACGKRQKALDCKEKSESTESNQNENDPGLDAPAI